MKFYVGITDKRWFEFHRRHGPDEVNFWRPGGIQNFRAIETSAPFLFKLHYPINKIVGGGFFVAHSNLPLSVAWDTFRQKNGTENFEELCQMIRRLRGDEAPNPVIGCTVLSAPFLWDEELWLSVPQDWGRSIVQGKTYDTAEIVGRHLWEQVQDRLDARPWAERGFRVAEPPARYSGEFVTCARLGQGGFRVLVTESYHRRCAMTGERTLPVLEAAHIKPYADEGPHAVSNGLCLRSDLHTLFDRGYVTITPDLKIRVSSRIRQEFSNGRDYYALDGRDLLNVPDRAADRPAREFIQWHNDRFVA